MTNIDDLNLPENVSDALKAAQIEAAENARATAVSAKESNLPLAVEKDGEYYVNTHYINALIQTLSMKALLGATTTKDLTSLLLQLANAVDAAKIYADEVDTLV